MAKNKKTISVPFFDMFKYAFVGTFGVMSAYILVALYSLIFVSIGLYLINKYNKKNTETFKQLQFGQYIGLIFVFLGLLPYLQYFFISLMIEGGEYAFHQMINN